MLVGDQMMAPSEFVQVELVRIGVVSLKLTKFLTEDRQSRLSVNQ